MGGRGSSFGANNDSANKDKVYDWLGHLKSKGGRLQPIDITPYREQSLEQVEGRLRSLPYEEAFVFDKNGRVIAAYRGDAGSVALPAELLHEKDITVTHGHPKGEAEFGGTFSFADMGNMLKSNWAEHRATASGQGEMNYIIRKTPAADAKGFYNQINRDYVDLCSRMDHTYKSVYHEECRDGAKKAQALHKARQESVGILNAYYKEKAAQFGYEYIARKKDYKYGR